MLPLSFGESCRSTPELSRTTKRRWLERIVSSQSGDFFCHAALFPCLPGTR